MNNVTLASCSYNTPLVTITMLKSFFKHHNETSVLICDNSTNNDTADLLSENNVPFFRNEGGLHSPSVDLLLEKCTTDYMLLVDTDVVFLKNHQSLFDQFVKNNLTLMGDICGDRGGKSLHYRVHPWHCFIRVADIKKHNIKFFEPDRLTDRTQTKIYDVGASFFEDIRKHKLKIGDIKVQDIYFKHYEGMSWRTQKFGNNDGNIDVDSLATHCNENLYKYGMLVSRMYEPEIKLHADIKIKCK